jgi:putative transposase
VIRRDGVSLVEWKSVAKLEKLAEKYPWRYHRDADGRWSAPQIERKLSEWGISYQIQTDRDLSPRWTENILNLRDYYHPGAEPCPPEVLQRVRAALQEEQALFLADFYDEPYRFTPDQLLKAIADQELVADLTREPVTEPRRCRVYRDEAVRELLVGYRQDSATTTLASYEFQIEAGVAFVFEGQRYEIALVGEKSLVLTDACGKQTEVEHGWLNKQHEVGRLTAESHPVQQLRQQISQYTEAELRTALHRQEILVRDDGASDRTKRRWRQKELAAQLNHSNEVLALVPRVRDRGNHAARLTPEQEEILTKVIESEWLTHRAQNYKSCHRHLLLACDAAGVDAPSYPTLIERIKSLDHTRSTRARHGKRRAYHEGDFVHVLCYDTPVHGSRPFQYCHIDHTELDIELICSRTGINLGRPWFSLAIDSFTRRILGIYLTYDPPSYHSNMMVLRDIVRRHNRLPQFIVTDNGKDFQSVNFETFLMAMDVYLRFRPAGRPRHGAVLERMFGRAHSEYVHNLAGNTKATKNVRMTTGKFLPKRLAEWYLEALYYGIEHWAFDYYDQDPHPALGLSPRAAHEKGIAESGARTHRHLLCNTDFLIATCPAVDREGVRKVDRQRGVKANDFFYWAPEFRDLKVAGRKVPVRYDPWDASTVYARIDHAWVRCICSTLAGLGQMTDAERKALSDEYRHRNGEKPDSTVSMQRLREFISTFTPEGAMALHRARQAENKALYGGLGQAAVISPVSTLTPTLALTNRVQQGIPAPMTNAMSPQLDGELTEFDTF